MKTTFLAHFNPCHGLMQSGLAGVAGAGPPSANQPQIREHSTPPPTDNVQKAAGSLTIDNTAQPQMEVTKFVASGREKAKLEGDYATYRKGLSNRIHNLRKKLGIATKPRAKYDSGKTQVTAEDIARNHEYVGLSVVASNICANIPPGLFASCCSPRSVLGHMQCL